MIDLIYYGIGGYDASSLDAKYKILLPERSVNSYEFPNIYNFSNNGENVILIHMQVTDTNPDYDLSTVGDFRNVTLKSVDFNLSTVKAISSGEDPLDYSKEINVIVYHDDNFILSKAIEKFFKQDFFQHGKNKGKDSKDTPKKSGFGTLKPAL